MEIIPSDVIKTLPKQEFSLVFQKVKELEKTGAQIINLGQGNPDLPHRRISLKPCGRLR